MSEPLSEDEIIAIVSRYEQPVPCPECRGLGTIDDMQGAIMCPSCKGNGDKSYPPPSDIIQLVAEVRRLREENDRLASLFQTTHHVHHGWVEAGMRTIRAEHERDAARADLARAVELLRLWLAQEEPMTVETESFLSNMEKR